MSECGTINEARWQAVQKWLRTALVGSVVLTAVAGYVASRWLEGIARSWQRELREAQRKALAKQQVLAALERAQQQLRRAHERWRAIRRQVPERADRPGFFQQLVSLADRCGLALANLAPAGERKRDRYAEFYLKGDATGDYRAVAQFLWHFSRLERAARMTQLTLRREGELYHITFTVAVPYGLARAEQTQQHLKPGT